MDPIPAGEIAMNWIRSHRLLERMYILLEECGMPDRLPHADILYELFWMLEEHFEEEEE